MSDLSNITINGRPLKVFVDEEVQQEVNTHHAAEIGTIARSTRCHILSNSIRNHSRARSSKGRVIYSAAMGGWQ